ncbi:hypothetical protein [Neobacillus drentensis]|uniref:hypothetical protein n=1 Tax=Neobacillus drentensis TaxID=220684 RepID=UPI003001F926
MAIFFIYSLFELIVIDSSRKILDDQYFKSLLTMALMGKMDSGMLEKREQS